MKENETLGRFLQRALDEGRLITRLRTVCGNALACKEKDPKNSPLDKPVKEVKFMDLHFIRGMGEVTWQEFVKLRERG